MKKQCVVDVDLADVWAEPGRKKFVRSVAWGDHVTVTGESPERLEITTVDFVEQPDGSIVPVPQIGFIEPKASSGLKATDAVIPKAQNRVLKVNFVDVQQGDGSVIESPDGKVILVDGGDNQLFARYLASRFRGTSLANPQDVECLLVTHGDADHFKGLPEILESESNTDPKKRLFMRPKRYYHNGLVKRPSTKNGKSVSDLDLLGPTKKVDGVTYLTGLESNLLTVPDTEMNEPFREWRDALKVYNARDAITFKRLQFGDTQAFAFFNTPDLKIEVLGPLVETVAGGPALKFLGNPPKDRASARSRSISTPPDSRATRRHTRSTATRSCSA